MGPTLIFFISAAIHAIPGSLLRAEGRKPAERRKAHGAHHNEIFLHFPLPCVTWTYDDDFKEKNRAKSLGCYIQVAKLEEASAVGDSPALEHQKNFWRTSKKSPVLDGKSVLWTLLLCRPFAEEHALDRSDFWSRKANPIARCSAEGWAWLRTWALGGGDTSEYYKK